MALVSDHLVVRAGGTVPGPRRVEPRPAMPSAGRVRSAVARGAGVLRAVSSAAFCASATPELDDAGVLRTSVAQASRLA